PYAVLGSVFQYEAQALVSDGTLIVCDGQSVYSAPFQPPTALDISDDVLDLRITDRQSQESTLTLVLDTFDGAYGPNGDKLPSIQPGASIDVSLGYDGTLVQTHTFFLDTWTYTSVRADSTLTLRGRCALRLLDTPSDEVRDADAQSVGALVGELAGQVGLEVAALPGTTQFSEQIGCFSVTAGESWLAALRRLSAIFGFVFFADASARLRVVDPQPADAGTWTYGDEVYAYSYAYAADRANLIQVIGQNPPLPPGVPPPFTPAPPPFAISVDNADLAASGRPITRIIVDRLLTSSPQCALRAGLALAEEQRNAYAAEIATPINPIHEIGDVIAYSSDRLGINQLARIVALDWAITPESGTWLQHVHCAGV
ncbi:MAG: hypothetical protein ACRDFS_11880, partial [Chloroflexota bacterium]